MITSSNTKNILVHYCIGENLDGLIDSALSMGKGFDTVFNFAYINEDLGKEAQSCQKQMQQKVNERKLPADRVKYIAKKGKAFVELVNIAKELQAFTIVTRVAPKAPIFNLLNSDNPYTTIISAPCPVISLAPGVEKLNEIKQIIMPIDNTEGTRQKLPVACNIAKHFGATIHMLALCEDKGGEQKRKMQHYAEQSKRFVEDKGVKSTYDVILGRQICKTVLEHEETEKSDLMIITADDDTSFLFESVFEKVIRKSSIPIMSIPPKDTKHTWAGL